MKNDNFFAPFRRQHTGRLEVRMFGVTSVIERFVGFFLRRDNGGIANCRFLKSRLRVMKLKKFKNDKGEEVSVLKENILFTLTVLS